MRLYILGCRGVPARHGGFETFAEQFALYAAERGHNVTVACQAEPGEPDRVDHWRGIRRLTFSAPKGPKGTILFDLRSALAASNDRGATILTLGYNTAIFSVIHRLRGVRHFMNMDGVEWRRQKWSAPERLWLRLNEVFGANLANHLIADHPVIKEHLSTLTNPEKITVIPYGADRISAEPRQIVEMMDLDPGHYDLVIARPEPENSLLEIVKAYARADDELPLVVLGRYMPEENAYHARVLEAAKNSNIRFVGAIYDAEVVRQLRFHARIYMHGHQVGGTNPSLVEALAAGNAIVAHKNPYNKWVAGDDARFFANENELREILDELKGREDQLEIMRQSSRLRHQELFQTEMIMQAYEDLLMDSPALLRRWSSTPQDAQS